MVTRRKITRKEAHLWLLFAVSVCFAIGSVGFFLAGITQYASNAAILNAMNVQGQGQDAMAQTVASSGTEASATPAETSARLKALEDFGTHE